MKLEAYAKLNLGLSVLSKRADGFHELDTVFARIDVHDTLELEPQASGIDLSITGANLPTDSNNLCYRAAEIYLRKANIRTGVAISLEKRIPIAAGLGGGSADAAAALRALAEIYPVEVDLLGLAAELGSDVAFFVLDVPAARGQGRGEVLEPLNLPKLDLVLINPGIHVSAGEAYAALDTVTPPLKLEAILGSVANPNQEPSYFNALQPGVLKAHPDIEAVLSALSEAGLRGALLSGSGSTCFAVARDKSEATKVAASLSTEHPHWWVQAAETL